MAESLDRLAAALTDRYRLERELGAGGMATVYLAQDLKHDRRVAIKVLRPELAAVLGAERFVQEIKTTAALSHPHILPLFDSGEAGGQLYYVMPYIEGETIREKLNRETQFGIDEAVRISREVADALDYAHRHGVIHRDIKPENILLHDGRPMVMDFGIALAVSAAAGGRMTETGLSLGTPHYMSPEQATADRDITARSDIYSLGSVLYEMLAGEPPHLGNSAQQIIMKIVTEDAAPVTRLRKSVPPNVAAAVARSLEKLPADRFETAKEFADALSNPGFTTAGLAASGTQAVNRSWIRDPRTMVTLGVAAFAVGWALLSRPGVSVAPTSYALGLPAHASMSTDWGIGFDVDPAGRFLVYQTEAPEGSALWYRSLGDSTTRRIEGTDGGSQPAISPDGRRLAFIRGQRGGEDWTLEVVPVDGGAAVTISRGADDVSSLDWLADGRIQLLRSDGKLANWFDPDGGTITARPVVYCINAAPLPDPDAMLCGGGGEKVAYRTSVRDSSRTEDFWRESDDSAAVLGAGFQVIDDRYLVYLSVGGDLMAAPVDLATNRVGKAVRMASGLGRRFYTGAGTFALSRTGTMVYAQGIDEAVGHLVTAGDTGLDTLPVGRERFLRFTVQRIGRPLAAVVDVREGEELRIYDLTTGRHVVWVRREEIRQPVWSPAGDRILFSVGDSVFVGSPELAGPPELLVVAEGEFEGYAWLPDGRVIGTLWGAYAGAAIDANRRPVVLDTLFPDATFTRPSPDARWIAYSNAAIDAIMLQRMPSDGRRFTVAASGRYGAEPNWLPNGQLTFMSSLGREASIERVDIDVTRSPPFFGRQQWVVIPDFRDTAGQSFAITPDGRVLYVRGDKVPPVRFFRVIPNWVDQMKRAVDEANR